MLFCSALCRLYLCPFDIGKSILKLPNIFVPLRVILQELVCITIGLFIHHVFKAGSPLIHIFYLGRLVVPGVCPELFCLLYQFV
jgi:hypothetical protein